jgi:hypothetical protein
LENVGSSELERETFALLSIIKKQFDSQETRASIKEWLITRIGSHVIQDNEQEECLASEEVLHSTIVRYLQHERYRRMRSLAFRKKRMEAQAKLRLDTQLRKQLAKNKNRQDAARKRVRDQNGKF